MNWYVAVLLIAALIPGFLGASKEGMLTPLVCWLMVCAFFRYRFSWFQSAIIFAVMAVVWLFVYPFSQNARDPVRAAATLDEKVVIIMQYIRDPSSFPNGTSQSDAETQFGTDSTKVGIIQRYSLLQSIDMLVGADMKQGFTGIDPYLPVLYSFIPHALWPDRPAVITSNLLGHKAGFRLNEQDTSTGIAIGSPALFFDLGGWVALPVYTILLFLVFFFLSLRAVGRTDRSVWGLVLIGTETMIAGPAGPASLVSLVVLSLTTFACMLVALKLLSRLSEVLLARQTV